jgi:hypothetical protein
MAGAPTTGEVYLFPLTDEFMGGSDAHGYVQTSFSTSLLNGGTGLPFNFSGTATRSLMEFDLTGTDEVTLNAGTRYAVDIRNTGSDTMFWTRGGNPSHLNDYLPGNIYATNDSTQPGERYDVVDMARRDGTLAVYAGPPPGLVTSNNPDAAAWPGSPVHTTTGSEDLQSVFNIEVTLGPGGAVAHTFTPDTSFKLDKFMIRAAGSPTNGELYLFQEPTGGTEADGFVNVGFSTSLLNGGNPLPFSFSGTGTRTILEFDLMGDNEITLQAGVKYAIDLRNTGGGTMYWMRGINPYSGGNIYAQNPAPDGQRFDVVGGSQRRDGSLALFVPPPAVEADYNGDGSVDVADYVLWRNGGPLLNEVDMPGTVNDADYTAWAARFGNPPGAAAGTSGNAVPEPAAWLVAGIAICLLGLRRASK